MFMKDTPKPLKNSSTWNKFCFPGPAFCFSLNFIFEVETYKTSTKITSCHYCHRRSKDSKCQSEDLFQVLLITFLICVKIFFVYIIIYVPFNNFNDKIANELSLTMDYAFDILNLLDHYAWEKFAFQRYTVAVNKIVTCKS